MGIAFPTIFLKHRPLVVFWKPRAQGNIVVGSLH